MNDISTVLLRIGGLEGYYVAVTAFESKTRGVFRKIPLGHE
jgi:hypothetical protein